MEAMHVWRAKFDVCHTKLNMLHAIFYIFMPCFICYMPILMYIVSSFVRDVLIISLHAMSISTFCMIIHMLYTKICILVAFRLYQDSYFVLFSLIHVVSTQIYVASILQIYVASRFVSSLTFSITHTVRSYHHLQ